jgi:hypothetical protein
MDPFCDPEARLGASVARQCSRNRCLDAAETSDFRRDRRGPASRANSKRPGHGPDPSFCTLQGPLTCGDVLILSVTWEFSFACNGVVSLRCAFGRGTPTGPLMSPDRLHEETAAWAKAHPLGPRGRTSQVSSTRRSVATALFAGAISNGGAPGSGMGWVRARSGRCLQLALGSVVSDK